MEPATGRARSQAVDAHNEYTDEYLTGEPLLEHLAADLDPVGLSCADFESGHV
jgi:hypothetical protein